MPTNDELLTALAEAVDEHAFAKGRKNTATKRFDQQEARRISVQVLTRLRDLGPSEEMVRKTLLYADDVGLDEDFGASVIEAMPPLQPEQQFDGIRAASEVHRDFNLMLTSLIGGAK